MPLSDSVGPEMVAFRRVVVDDVEDDLEAGGVQRAHHPLEFADRARRRARRGKSPLGREVAEAVVAPVVRQPLFLEMPVARVMMHRHQLDGGDAELLQVIERRFGRQRLVGAAQLLGKIADAASRSRARASRR